MTHDEKINYMRLACRLSIQEMSNMEADLLISLYELVKEKQGELSLQDIVEAENEVQERAETRKDRTLLDKVSTKIDSNE